MRLEEVVRSRVAGGHAAGLLWGSLEDLEVLVHMLIQLEDGRDVPAAVAVVGRGPDRDQLLVEHELEALHDELQPQRRFGV